MSIATALVFLGPGAFSIEDDFAPSEPARVHQRKTVIEHAGMYPRYLPSGHLVYVTKGNLFAIPFDLERLEVRGTATLLEEVASSSNLGSAQFDFARNGTLVYRTGRSEGLRTIQWLDRSGRPNLPRKKNHQRRVFCGTIHQHDGREFKE